MDQFSRIIAEDVLVFAYCSDDQIEADYAVAQLERIAQQLRETDTQGASQFIQTIRAMEQEARNQGLDERAERLALMPTHLGLES